jgi:hypothetical protein
LTLWPHKLKIPEVTILEGRHMVEPLSLAALGALAATEGIKFLYGQAAEVLKRWRDNKSGKTAEAQAPIPVQPPAAALLQGSIQSPTINFEVLESLQGDIGKLASVLGNYAGGLEEPDPDDQELAVAADALRQALEAVYGQRITFRGENRQPSGPIVVGRVDAAKVAGAVAGVRARLVRSGRVQGTASAEEVSESGQLSGVNIDTVG